MIWNIAINRNKDKIVSQIFIDNETDTEYREFQAILIGLFGHDICLTTVLTGIIKFGVVNCLIQLTNIGNLKFQGRHQIECVSYISMKENCQPQFLQYPQQYD